jgi:hypothetical protein
MRFNRTVIAWFGVIAAKLYSAPEWLGMSMVVVACVLSLFYLWLDEQS